MAEQLDRDRVEAFLVAACERVAGDLVLVGGALVAAWLSDRRRTEDIDIIVLGDRAQMQLELWDVAEACSLPIEAVNGAAEFFLRRIPGWEESLEPFRQGAKGRILRPNPTLFLLTKIGRLSETDLGDCRLVLERASCSELEVDRARVLEGLADLDSDDDAAVVGRRAELRRLLE